MGTIEVNVTVEKEGENVVMKVVEMDVWFREGGEIGGKRYRGDRGAY